MSRAPGLTCRHDVTPRSACKLCKAEDARMRRGPNAIHRKPKKKIPKNIPLSHLQCTR